MKKMAVLNPPRTMLEVFECLPEGTLCQLINDNLVMSPVPSDSHQNVLVKIFARLLHYVEEQQLGEIRILPYDVYFNRKNIYQPDIIFIATENVKNIADNGLHGTPDLVVEVLSPKTAKYDLEDKKDVYERYGVKEYWTVDPVSKQVSFFKLANGEYIEVKVENGVIKSELLNTEIRF